MREVKKTKYGTWQIRWRENGRQRAKTFRQKELALKYSYELAERLRRHEGSQKEVLFETFAKEWHEGYCKIEKAESQWFDDRSIIDNHLAPAFGNCYLHDLTKADLLRLRGKLKTEKMLSDKSINNVTGLAKKMLQTAVDWDYLNASPWEGVKPLRLAEVDWEYWTSEERDRFLRFCKREDPEFWEIAAFACHTGLRSGEIAGLCRDALDFDRRMISVKQNYSEKYRRLWKYTKGKRIRRVEMNQVVWEILQRRRLLPPDSAVFPRFTHKSRRLKEVAQKAKVKPITFHDLRHTFASGLAMAGVPLHKIQHVLGHTDVRMTQRYAHLHPDSLTGITDHLVHESCTVGKKEAKVSGIKA